MARSPTQLPWKDLVSLRATFAIFDAQALAVWESLCRPHNEMLDDPIGFHGLLRLEDAGHDIEATQKVEVVIDSDDRELFQTVRERSLGHLRPFGHRERSAARSAAYSARRHVVDDTLPSLGAPPLP